MSTPKLNTILIVEPRKELAAPYTHFPQDSNLVHLKSTRKAVQYLQNVKPDLVTISASYAPKLVFELLEAVKEKSTHNRFLIPIALVVDLKTKTSYIPGTTWAQKLGLLYSLNTKQEVALILGRICEEQRTLGYN